MLSWKGYASDNVRTIDDALQDTRVFGVVFSSVSRFLMLQLVRRFNHRHSRGSKVMDTAFIYGIREPLLLKVSPENVAFQKLTGRTMSLREENFVVIDVGSHVTKAGMGVSDTNKPPNVVRIVVCQIYSTRTIKRANARPSFNRSLIWPISIIQLKTT